MQISLQDERSPMNSMKANVFDTALVKACSIDACSRKVGAACSQKERQLYRSSNVLHYI